MHSRIEFVLVGCLFVVVFLKTFLLDSKCNVLGDFLLFMSCLYKKHFVGLKTTSLSEICLKFLNLTIGSSM